ncbi:MAG: hypothetical protein WCZ98_00265 [Sideroxydans sp.]
MKSGFSRIAAIAWLCCSSSAFALSEQEAAEQSISTSIQATKPGLHMLINVGMTYGGDTVATAVFTNGSSTDIKGGGLLQFGAGGLYQFEQQPIALMLSANYHFHSVSGANGSISFDRLPIEALAYYTGKERFRIGGGVRIVNSPEADSTAPGSGFDIKNITYKNTTGLVAEIGYQLSSEGWLNFRFVSEKYQGETATAYNGATASLASVSPKSGSHLGVNFTYEF